MSEEKSQYQARPQHDQVNHPSHYTSGGIETIDYLQAKLTAEEFGGFCRGNVLKYVSRSWQKGGVEDLKKAAWYLDRLIRHVERRPDPEEN